MCVFAVPAAAAAAGGASAGAGIFGLGAAASNMFLAQLGIAAVTTGAQVAQANKIAS